MKITYLGPKGTFTEKVTKKLFPDQEISPLPTIRNVIFSIENNQADLAVVPIENFYNGEVRETLDALNECKQAKIIQEDSLEIVHCLGALKNHTTINKILSKDQALEQCSHFLMNKFPAVQTMAVSSTAEAAQKIKSENLLDSAVIASKEAIIDSGLEILETNLLKNNKTRFVIIGREQTTPTGKDKTLISIHPSKDKPGTLSICLGFLSNLGINLESIISRPDKKSGYYFYIELEGHNQDKNVKMALEAIKFYLDSENKHPDTIKILGSYKNSHWKKPEATLG